MASRFNAPSNNISQELNLLKVWDLFSKRWYLVVITMAFALICSKLYLRYSRPVYVAAATVKVEDNSTKLSSLDFLEELANPTDNIQSEMQIIQSRHMIMRALEKIKEKISVSYFNVGNLLVSEMYNRTPFRVHYDPEQKGIPYGRDFFMHYLGGNRYRLVFEDQSGGSYTGEHQFGELINMNGFKLRVSKVEEPTYTMKNNEEFRFQLNNIRGISGRVRAGLTIDQLAFNVSIIRITYKDYVPEFCSDFVNALCEVYVEENLELKTQAASQAVNFIKSQVDSIQRDVERAEKILEGFKADREMINLDQKAEMDLRELQELESEYALLELEKVDIRALENQLAAKAPTLALPINLGMQSDGNLTSLLQSHNALVQERLGLEEKYNANHPQVVEINKKIADVRAAVDANVGAIRKRNSAKMELIKGKIEEAKKALKTLPQTQREYITLSREYEVKEEILNMLLEKQAEASISEASIVSNVRIVDSALPPSRPISPIARKVYTLGIGLGICLGLILVMLTGLLKNTISYREEVEGISRTPLIGVVRRSSVSGKNQYPQLVCLENPKSSLSESIRSIRTNLQFIAAGENTKIVSITSTVSGEGKSFIALNLAGIISLLNKRVIILDMDLRRPKLHFSMGMDNSRGLSTYLVNQHTLEEVVQQSPFENLEIITSGPIPPNPAELTQGFRLELLLKELKKKYDYVIVDTPPVGLVTDSISLLKQSDAILYVLRADYSKKSYARIPDQLVEEHRIKNLYLVLNSVNESTGRYGGYGYKVYASGYYSDDEQYVPWWKFWARKK